MPVEFEEDALLTPVYESLFEGFAKCVRRRQIKQNNCIDDVLHRTITQDLHRALAMPFHGYTIKGNTLSQNYRKSATTRLNRLDIRNWIFKTIVPDLSERAASMKKIDIEYAPCLHREAVYDEGHEDSIDNAWNGRHACLSRVYNAQHLALTQRFDLKLGICVDDCKEVYSNYENECTKFKEQWNAVERLLERKPSIMRLAPRYAHSSDYVPKGRRFKRVENQL